MDDRRFDLPAKTLSAAPSRRGLLAGLLAAFPWLPDPADAREKGGDARRGRERDGDRDRGADAEHHGKGRRRKRKCKRRSAAQTCANKCGVVVDNCNRAVDCGSCDCGGPCPVCHRCAGNPVACRPDPDFRGLACGTGNQPGLVCQTDGSCACDAGSCPPPLTCGGGGEPGRCGCAPATCAAKGAECGSVGDGCGGALDCGSCGGGRVCGGNNRCRACESTAECGTGRICVDGACRACDVTCPGVPYACGDELIRTLANPPGTTLYVCPGTYRGGFTIDRPLTLVGAGDGEDPAANTVLDGALVRRTVRIGAFDDPVGVVYVADGTAGAVALRQMRIVRGGYSGVSHYGAGPLAMRDCALADSLGDGVYVAGGGNLEMRDCAASGNRGSGVRFGGDGELTMAGCALRGNGPPADGRAGGLTLFSARATLTDCEVAGNSGYEGGGMQALHGATLVLAGATVVRDNAVVDPDGYFGGGGIFASGDDTSVTVGPDCRITGNTAPVAGQGGGIRNHGATVALPGSDPASIVVGNCRDNCAGEVPGCSNEETSCPA